MDIGQVDECFLQYQPEAEEGYSGAGKEVPSPVAVYQGEREKQEEKTMATEQRIPNIRGK